MMIQPERTYSADTVFKSFVHDTKKPNWDFLDTLDGGSLEPKNNEPPNFADYFSISDCWPIKKMTDEVNEQIFDLQPPDDDESELNGSQNDTIGKDARESGEIVVAGDSGQIAWEKKSEMNRAA